MHKGFLVTASLLAALSVALGAFGAHALKEIVTPQQLNTFETAVRYQFYHAFALMVTGILLKSFPHNWIKQAGTFFIAGMVLFSGSLYLLTAITASGNDHFKWLGAVTPLGGLFFLFGWLALAIGITKSHQHP